MSKIRIQVRVGKSNKGKRKITVAKAKSSIVFRQAQQPCCP